MAHRPPLPTFNAYFLDSYLQTAFSTGMLAFYFMISKNAGGMYTHTRADSDESSFACSLLPFPLSCLRHSVPLPSLPHFQKGENRIKNIEKYNFLCILLLDFGVECFSIIWKLELELLVDSSDKNTYKYMYIYLFWGREKCQYNWL